MDITGPNNLEEEEEKEEKRKRTTTSVRNMEGGERK
ncbi:MAG: hypothetical protein ACI8RD_001699 [Bacillariaceae sp.]|jgi:hypothetical protein